MLSKGRRVKKKIRCSADPLVSSRQGLRQKRLRIPAPPVRPNAYQTAPLREIVEIRVPLRMLEDTKECGNNSELALTMEERLHLKKSASVVAKDSTLMVTIFT